MIYFHYGVERNENAIQISNETSTFVEKKVECSINSIELIRTMLAIANMISTTRNEFYKMYRSADEQFKRHTLL